MCSLQPMRHHIEPILLEEETSFVKPANFGFGRLRSIRISGISASHRPSDAKRPS
jgi:hypothetical protein